MNADLKISDKKQTYKSYQVQNIRFNIQVLMFVLMKKYYTTVEQFDKTALLIINYYCDINVF